MTCDIKDKFCYAFTLYVQDIAWQTLLYTEGGISIFFHSVGFQVPNFMVSHC